MDEQPHIKLSHDAATPDIELVEADIDEPTNINEVVPVPTDLGTGLTAEVKSEIHEALLAQPGQISEVYRAMVKLPGAGPTQLHSLTTCANAGVVGNLRASIWSVMGDEITTSPHRARQAASTARALLKSVDGDSARQWLVSVLAELEKNSSNSQAIEAEEEKLEVESAQLVEELKKASGVYVYTYPHYWKHPMSSDSERRYLKVGQTSKKAWKRVLEQARQTGMPEDPLLLRVYETDDPTGAEKKFHMLINAAEHRQSVGQSAGKEWFITTVDFCDAIAGILNLTVHKGDSEASPDHL